MKTPNELMVEEAIGSPPQIGDPLPCEGCKEAFEYDGKCDLYCPHCRGGMELNLLMKD